MIPTGLPFDITGIELKFFFSISSITSVAFAVRSTDMSGDDIMSRTSKFRINRDDFFNCIFNPVIRLALF